MSQKYYQNVWFQQNHNLKEIAKQDELVTLGGPYRDRQETKNIIGNLFVRYSKIANKICGAADGLRDPILVVQVRKMYELTVARVLQLSDELSRLLAENNVCLHSILIENKTTPFDIRLKVPSYFEEGRKIIIEKRKKWFEEIRTAIKIEEQEIADSEKFVEEKTLDQLQDALLKRTSTISKDGTFIRRHTSSSNVESTNSYQRIASILSSDAEQEQPKENSAAAKELVAKEKNRKIQEIMRQEYAEISAKTYEKLRSKVGSKIEEGVEDEVREWIEEFYSAISEFTPFPPQEAVYITGETYGVPKKLPKQFVESNFKDSLTVIPKGTFSRDFASLAKLGGSALIAAGYWIKPDEWVKCQAQLKKKDGKGKEKSSKKTKRGTAKTQGFNLKETDHFTIRKCLEEHPPVDDILLEAFYHLGMEVRENIDELMRVEVELLQDALYKDKHPKKKRKKGKKRANKRKKGKRKKDPTASKTTEECMEELVRCGVLREGNGARMEDLIADSSWSEQPETSNGEIIDFLLQRCVLPLSSANVHQLAPLTRSICLMGPQNSGKQFLADIVVTATDAAVFDLSPETTANIYPGKKGLKMLMALVYRLSRELQPSVILVTDIEKVFYQKVPKNEKKLNPRRIRGVLAKFVKNIKAADRVMMMATSSQPWLAKRKKLTKTCEWFINIPCKHYGTHRSIWQHSLTGCQSEIPAISKVSSRVGNTFKKIEDAATHDNNETRTESGMLDILENLQLPNDKLLNKYHIFSTKTPIGISKLKLQQALQKPIKKLQRK